jgi:hypothetical protein
LIGVTINGGGEFSALAEEARHRFMWATGLNCVVIHTQQPKNYAVKMELLSLFDQTVVFFDADLWFIQKRDLCEFDDCEEFFGVQDPGGYHKAHFPFWDCQTLGIEVEPYINTGFMIFNQRHKQAMAKGLEMMKDNSIQLKDFGEQSYINGGLQLTKTPIKHLHPEFNYIPLAVSRSDMRMEHLSNPVTIHAAGFLGHQKFDRLRGYALDYGGNPSARPYSTRANIYTEPSSR